MEGKTLLISLLILVISGGLHAQINISGTVIDQKGEHLVGANVFIENSYDGASTDINGSFSFETLEEDQQLLSVSYIGYKKWTQSVSLDKDVEIEIVLEEAINKLDAVVISAGSFDAGQGTKSEVLKPLDIVTTAGATADIAGALNSLPGTQVVGEEGRLFVRGGDGSETKTFIDGMQVLDAYETSITSTPTRGRFSPFMFNGTSFSTGGYSAEYGQALSSALILDTKGKSVQNRTDLSLMAVGTDLSHSKSWDKSSIVVQGAYYDLTPLFKIVPQNTEWVKAPKSIEGNIATRTQIGSSGIVKAYGKFAKNTMKLVEYDPFNDSISKSVHLINDYYYGNSTLKNQLGKSWSYKVGGAYTYNSNIYDLEEECIETLAQGSHIKATIQGDVNEWFVLNTGAEFFHEKISQSYELRLVDFNNHREYYKPLYSYFLEGDLYLSNDFLIRGGGRMEFNQLSGEFYLDPRFSMAYKIGEHGQASFATGRFRQSVEREYLLQDNDLLSQQSDHFILNYQYVTPNQTFRIEGYHKNYTNLVKYSSIPAQSDVDYFNDGFGYARGIDIFWRDNKSLKNVDYWISYSFLDTEREYLDFPTEAAPTFTSKHNFSAVYKHFLTSIKIQVSGTFTYASGRPFNNPNLEDFNGGKTPEYVDLSLSISYLATPKTILYASVTNVLGRQNVFGYKYNNSINEQGIYDRVEITLPAPRFYFVGVFITFSKDKTLNQLRTL